MTTKWTREQLAAIAAKGNNVLVAAAAGAGKTAVLVERVIRLLCDQKQPVDIDRLLVVTFTEAAAAEMRDRIAAALEKTITEAGRYELARQLPLLGGAAISTMHSFCLSVIRRYFYLLDIDPAFRVAAETEAALMKNDAAAMVLEQAFTDGDEEIFALLADYDGNIETKIQKDIVHLYNLAWSNPRPRQWLKRAVRMYEEVPAAAEKMLTTWLEPVRSEIRLLLEEAAACLQEAMVYAQKPGGPQTYLPLLESEAEKMQKLMQLTAGPWEELRAAWLEFIFDRLPPAKGEAEVLKDEAQALRERAKKLITSAREKYFMRSLQEFTGEIRLLAPKVRALATLVLQFAETYQSLKKQAGVMDFTDLEHYALQILSQGANKAGELLPSAAALELRRQYEHVLVDEYQDINPVQDAILQLVSRQGEETPNLFMVGDVKQSIYRFRLGEPGIFLAIYHAFGAEEGIRILLRHNFRCRHSVVDAVNFLFSRLMTKEAAEIDYDESAALIGGARYPESLQPTAATEPVEVILLDTGMDPVAASPPEEDEESDIAFLDYTAFERECLFVAAKIKELMSPERLYIYDKELGKYRPLQYADIVILLRTTTGRADRMADILSAHGIPAYAELETGYFAAMEIKIMLALLAVIDNPQQDIPLAAVLRSPFVGLGVEELALIRQTGGHESNFWQAVKAAAAAGLPNVSAKLAAFLECLDRWRTLARRMRLSEFIATVYRESRFIDFVAGLPAGERRKANLHALFSRARQFDRFSRQGLSRFLAFIEQLRLAGEDLGSARVLGEKENVVRILSIHKAKGLEFPVVFLCDTGKQFNFQDQRASLLVHRSLGLAPLVVDKKGRTRYPSLPYLALRLRGEAETRAEEMRLLYVALTRAREKLYIVGSMGNLAQKLPAWRQAGAGDGPLPARLICKANCFLDWIGPALACFLPADKQSAGQETKEETPFAVSVLPSPAPAAAAKEEEGQERAVKQALLALQPLPLATDDHLRDSVRTCLAYTYPAMSTPVPAKLSVTELKRRLDLAGEGESRLYPAAPWQRPRFLAQAAGPGAAELGTLYHTALQYLDLNLPLDEAGIKEQLVILTAQGKLDAALLPWLDAAKISAFFHSEPGRILLRYRKKAMREWPFTLALPAHELFPGLDDTIIVQGIIDLLIPVREGFVLVDYKTDRLPEGGMPALAARYATQFKYYIRAVETILKQPVAAAYLYAITAACDFRVA
ncbi:MAG: helicase-exonuclease AddAB subunit AddA [Firmicutes bacterium]|nr:helicase-exonuclease AddAB subunit AddA [Bacillota bacterium]